MLVGDDGEVTVESRAICAKLCGAKRRGAGAQPLGGTDLGLRRLVRRAARGRDVPHRGAAQVPRLKSAWERALYVFVKERKFGRGCVAEWGRERDQLHARAVELLRPTPRRCAGSHFSSARADARRRGSLRSDGHARGGRGLPPGRSRRRLSTVDAQAGGGGVPQVEARSHSLWPWLRASSLVLHPHPRFSSRRFPFALTATSNPQTSGFVGLAEQWKTTGREPGMRTGNVA